MAPQRRREFRRVIRARKTEFELDYRHVALQRDSLNGLCLSESLAQIRIDIGAQLVADSLCGIVGRSHGAILTHTDWDVRYGIILEKVRIKTRSAALIR